MHERRARATLWERSEKWALEPPLVASGMVRLIRCAAPVFSKTVPAVSERILLRTARHLWKVAPSFPDMFHRAAGVPQRDLGGRRVHPPLFLFQGPSPSRRLRHKLA